MTARSSAARRSRLLSVAVLAVAMLASVTFLGDSARAADLQPPETSVTVPTLNQLFSGAGPFVLSGSASDDVTIARVNVAVQDRTSGRWLRADGSWNTAFAWLTGTVGTPNATSTTWRFSFTGPAGLYTVGAQAVDSSNKWDASPAWVRFQVATLPSDLQTPNATIAMPTPGQVLPGAGPFTLTGSATDDVRVSAVDVSIRDQVSGSWLSADGSMSSTQVWLPSTLTPVSGATVTWRYVFAGPVGLYNLAVRATDASGKVDPSPVTVSFEVALPPPPTSRPNIVLILTDDQRWDSASTMPSVQSLLVAHGVNFTNAFVVDPLCCPSRAAILKGAYAHTTGVYNNEGPYSPFVAFDDRSTVATWLEGAGYRTALIGKYFNAYTESRAAYVPPGWNRWVAFATTDVGGGRYYDYGLSLDGTLVTRGSATTDYSTDVLAGYADSFIRTADPNQPLFLYFTPYGPHEPATAAPRDLNTFPNLAPYRPPSFDEADVSDKPAYIRAIPRLTASQISRENLIRRKQLQTLQSVDDAVGTIVQALTDTGRLSNTMIVFMSDNGFSYGEHRWGLTGAQNKQVPYEESIRVPYVVRYDPLTATPRTDPNLVLNIDLAPTFAALAGAAAPGAEGRSLIPLLTTPATPWRTDFLVEHHLTGVPSYCAVRSTNAIYVRYNTREEELYLLASDPYQLANRATDPSQASLLASMRARAVQLCNPPPPGYSFP